ncbi:MAG: hypothetical protein JSR62_06800 [Nitrospira sp.]|nr:hypothetical protein [Nitrospira sp.]
MTNQNGSLTTLISDARLVLAYAARSGRLPSKALAEALARATSGSVDSEGDEELAVALASALNESIQAIAPVTLKDLGSDWQPFPISITGRITRTLFSFFAVAVVVATAYYTQLYSQANSLLLALRDIQSQNAIDKAERLFRFTFKNHQDLFGLTEKNEKHERQRQADKKDQDEVIFEPYLKHYVDLLKINDQWITYLPLSLELINETSHPVSNISSWIHSWFTRGASEGSSYPAVGGSEGKDKGYVYKGGNYESAESLREQSSIAKDDSSRVTGKLGSQQKLLSLTHGKGQSEESGPVEKLINKQRQLVEFLYHLGVGYIGPTVPKDRSDSVQVTSSGGYTLSSLIYQCQKLTAMLGIWVLPAMYGLLGAVVFQMRGILNPLVPDPSFERLLMRFSLGILAGVSISWVFGDSQPKAPGVYSWNTTLFGVSFLFGFSIDVFFALLDRAVEMVANSIVKKEK